MIHFKTKYLWWLLILGLAVFPFIARLSSASTLITIAAREMAASYQKDPLKADRTYKDRLWSIEGRVLGAGRTADDHFEIRLETPDGAPPVVIRYRYEQVERFNGLVPGTAVKFTGRFDGRDDKGRIVIQAWDAPKLSPK